jgi:hypothetical protein
VVEVVGVVGVVGVVEVVGVMGVVGMVGLFVCLFVGGNSAHGGQSKTSRKNHATST